MQKLALFFVLGAVVVGGCSSSSSGGAGGSAGSTGAGGAASGAGGDNGAPGGAAGEAAGGQGGTVAGGAAGADGAGGAGGAGALCGTDTEMSAPASCNTFAAAGPCVTATAGVGAIPISSGGIVVAGTYQLTAETAYAGPDGTTPLLATQRQTLVISNVTTVAGTNSQSFTLDEVVTNGTNTTRQTSSAVTSGASVSNTPTCPPPANATAGGTAQYTITATTLTIVLPTLTGGALVGVYVKVP